MMDLGETGSIKLWHDFLTQDCGLELGKDWRWAWQHNRWHIEFVNPSHETAVRLKMHYDY